MLLYFILLLILIQHPVKTGVGFLFWIYFNVSRNNKNPFQKFRTTLK